MINNISRRAIFAGVLTAMTFAATSPSAHAQFTTLTDGQAQQRVLANQETTPLTTAVQVATQRQAFSDAGSGQSLSGFLVSSVYRNTNNQLDFLYQIQVTNTTAGISATNLSNFANFTTAVAYSLTEATPPGTDEFVTTNLLRPFGSNRVGGQSDTPVAFTFNNSGDGFIGSGKNSAILDIRTNATTFTVSNGTVNAGAAANVTIYAPSTAVIAPEAGTFALLVPAFALGAVMIKLRKK